MIASEAPSLTHTMGPLCYILLQLRGDPSSAHDEGIVGVRATDLPTILKTDENLAFSLLSWQKQFMG